MSIASAGVESERLRQWREKWDRRFMRVAEEVASWSKDPGTHVGAVLIKDGKLIGTGYNGFPRLLADIGLEHRERKLSRTVHAEMNAVLNCANITDIHGATLYVTPLMCCDRCAVHMIQAGVKRVVCQMSQEVHDSEKLAEWKSSGALASRYFEEAGVEVTFMEPTP